MNSNDSTSIRRMVDSIDPLVEFACSNPDVIKEFTGDEFDSIINQLIVSRNLFHEKEKFETGEEIEFLKAYHKLSVSLSPVSLRSIQDCSPKVPNKATEKTPQFIVTIKGWSSVSKSLIIFSIISIFALALLLFTQIVWVYGAKAVEQIEESGPPISTPIESPTQAPSGPTPESQGQDPVDILNDLAESNPPPPSGEPDTTALADAAPQSGSEPEGGSGEIDLPIGPSVKLVEKLNKPSQINAAFELLENWWSLWPFGNRLLPEKDDTENSGNNFPETTMSRGNSVLIASKSIIYVLEVYMLPLLYGMVGACTFVLRKITDDMKHRQFRSEHFVSYLVRILLGVLAGLMIGWIAAPENIAGATSEVSPLRLAPFALSFIAGYSIDLLFMMMDRILIAFSSKAPVT